MKWYYVDAGKQAGPVDDAGLMALAVTGKITHDTLVWREGMANWQPFREVGTGAVAARVTGLEEVACAECGKTFPVGDTVKIGEVRVCLNCRPAFTRKMRGESE
jgi:hypothetical protein